ncbi:MAG: tyrosine-type recombinase/integrase [Henriciella sp.]|nr:tyrosine-type recombinase/integrase [Henriciella sp.]
MAASQICKNPNHPKKGSSIKVHPIRDRTAIADIKRKLLPSPRNHLMFVMGINTAYRMNELLSLTVRQVEYAFPGTIIDLKQSKQDRYRAVMINEAVFPSLSRWLAEHPAPNKDAPLFPSRKTGDALSVSTCCSLVKGWCAEAGLQGHYGSHTLRKTWAYHMRITYGQPVELIMKALGHKTPEETLRYVGILPEEVLDLYKIAV